mgnify:CR=1 FL=1
MKRMTKAMMEMLKKVMNTLKFKDMAEMFMSNNSKWIMLMTRMFMKNHNKWIMCNKKNSHHLFNIDNSSSKQNFHQTM